jgi:hypothetical protein
MIFTPSSKEIPRVRERRSENRLSHIRTVAIIPERDGRPSIAHALFGITGDMSPNGLSVYLTEAIPEADAAVFVALWIDGQADLIRASVRGVTFLTAKMCRLSLKLIGNLPPDAPGMSAMLQVAARLRE